MKIVVLAGGYSPERDVSLCSGSLIANSLIESGHSVLLLDLYIGIKATAPFDTLFVSKQDDKKYSHTVSTSEPDLKALANSVDNNGGFIGENVIEICKYADVVFVSLHGDIGENGKLQAVFDCFGIKYTGTGSIGSALAMDKDLSKKMMVNSGLPTPEWVLLDGENSDISSVGSEIGFPCVVKPCGAGSSVGISIVNDEQGLKDAISSAQQYEELIIVEKMIVGREFSISILGGKALPIIEIIVNDGFYDYVNKYQAGLAKEECPADLPHEVAAELQELAKRVHKSLRLGYYSRIDFILDEQNNAYCLEANTLPGMTPTSLLPQEAKAAGISYNELCERIIDMKAN